MGLQTMNHPPPSWDTQKGRLLYDQDLSHTAIARACGVSPSAVRQYAARNWPKRPIDIERSKLFHRARSARVKGPTHAERKANYLPALSSLQTE